MGQVGLSAAAEDQRESAVVGPDVADPLAVAAGRDQVLMAVDGEQIDRRAPRLAALTAPRLQHPGAEHADADPG